MATVSKVERTCSYCGHTGIIKEDLVREMNNQSNKISWVHSFGEIKYARQYVLDGKGKPTTEVAQYGTTKGRLCPEGKPKKSKAATKIVQEPQATE